MGTTQPLTLLVGVGIGSDTVERWKAQGHTIIVMDASLLYDGIVCERAWRSNDEMLKSVEGFMFKAMRAGKRAHTIKPAKKTRKPRKKVEAAPDGLV